MNDAKKNLAEKQAALCRLFGSARRLVILWEISQEELSVNEISNRVGSTLQNVSQHLSLLKRFGIVTTRRDGQMIYYHIADDEWLKHCPALQKAQETINSKIFNSHQT
jgi:DNA-binding transcriptional ArsR family regulator